MKRFSSLIAFVPEIDPPLIVKSTDIEDHFVEFDLSFESSSHGAETGKLPIREVIRGPLCDSESARRSLDDLLTCHEYHSVNLSRSAILLEE